MTVLESALAGIVRTLTEQRVPYMLVGGLANAVWGEPRATLDVDVVVWVEADELHTVVTALTPAFRSRTENPVDFVERLRVLPLETDDHVSIDLIFGLLPFEKDAIAHAVTVELAGTSVRVCRAEDLILMKIVSEREKDLADARRVTARQWRRLDLAYLEPRIAELAVLLERPTIVSTWHEWCASTRSAEQTEPS